MNSDTIPRNPELIEKLDAIVSSIEDLTEAVHRVADVLESWEDEDGGQLEAPKQEHEV